jgi:hypothetical protein
MSMQQEPGHGHSPAAWTAVIVSIAGLSVATMALFLELMVVFYIGLGVFVGGLLMGPLLAALGYGVHGPKWQPKDPH